MPHFYPWRAFAHSTIVSIKYIDNRGVFYVGMTDGWAHRIIYPEIDNFILLASVGSLIHYIQCRIGKCYTFFNLINCLKQRQPRHMNMLTDPSWSKPLQIKYQRPSVVTQTMIIAFRRLRSTGHGFDTSVGYMASSRLHSETLPQKIKMMKVTLALKYVGREKVFCEHGSYRSFHKKRRARQAAFS